jgi:hypothetical protein
MMPSGIASRGDYVARAGVDPAPLEASFSSIQSGAPDLILPQRLDESS